MVRRLAGVLGAFAAAFLLISAPAWASTTTISPNEGQQFVGVVDDSPSCAPANGAAVPIHWGDGVTSNGTYHSSTTTVTGAHKYAVDGTYSGTVVLPCGKTDDLDADVADQPLTASATQPAVNATASVQFTGAVATFTDADPGANASYFDGPETTIDWGDGTSPSSASITGPSNGTFTVNGTHTYATPGTYSISVQITDQSTANPPGGQSETFASSTATVGHAPPEFTECPPVDQDTGCQFLIIVTNGGQSIEEDPNQGPYEGADDSLIGVVNDSSTPINALPLSAPSLFGFDGDGICNPGSAPLPPGCRVAPGEPGGTSCGTQGDACSFPTPAGEPFGYKEPGATPPNSQNGYEGPTSWYSNVSSSEASGHVNFSPPIEPGQSTYFSLEAPPTTSPIIVGSRIPNYVPPPVLGKFFDVSVVSGIVYVKVPIRYLPPAGDLSYAGDPLATDAIVKGQGFIPLTEARQLPAGTVVDARLGKISLTAATGKGARTETGVFGGGIYGLSQDTHGRRTKGLMILSLDESAFPGAPSYRACRAHGAADAPAASAAGLSSKVLQTLRAKAHGRFEIRGRYSAATVRGTVWGVRDQCNGTRTIVTRGVVAVTDFVRHVTVFVHAGHSYLARAPSRR